ncbi:hypothetical protein GJ496_007934 [Pomphorhynchus laevis]|nr:hypothetical protein GJ496_007934 [Pomphorhynchus laevis]
MSAVNDIGPLKFTHTYGSSVDFLDVTIYQKDGKLLTKFFSKKTSKPVYLHAGSGHDKSTKRVMIYSEALRRICKLDVDFKESIRNLTSSLIDRGYTRRQIYNHVKHVRKLSQKQA